MRRNLKRICIYIVTGCLLMFTGCAGNEEDKGELVEVQGVEEEETVTPESDKPEEQPQTIFVYVCGQVASPGVYELESDSRLFEAVKAAGGMTDAAADTYLNQAEKLTDGQRIYVPSEKETEKNEQTVTEQEADDGKVNLNTASKEELMTLSGIGESKASAIIRYREENGGFESTEEIKEIEGIKDGVYNKVKDYIKV